MSWFHYICVALLLLHRLRFACSSIDYQHVRALLHYCASPPSLSSALPQVALYGIGRLLRPRPTLHGLWMGILLLYGAARIILPIIYAEGICAVFLPRLAARPIHGMRKVASAVAMS